MKDWQTIVPPQLLGSCLHSADHVLSELLIKAPRQPAINMPVSATACVCDAAARSRSGTGSQHARAPSLAGPRAARGGLPRCGSGCRLAPASHRPRIECPLTAGPTARLAGPTRYILGLVVMVVGVVRRRSQCAARQRPASELAPRPADAPARTDSDTLSALQVLPLTYALLKRKSPVSFKPNSY
jgi:hypothetical protein